MCGELTNTSANKLSPERHTYKGSSVAPMKKLQAVNEIQPMYVLSSPRKTVCFPNDFLERSIQKTCYVILRFCSLAPVGKQKLKKTKTACKGANVM